MSFLKGLTDGVTICIGYIPIAFSFGLASISYGIDPCITVGISVFVFAGASQFALISLLATGSSFIGILSTIFLMNIRHIFYGPSLTTKLRLSNKMKSLISFSLTDEVYAIAIGKIDSINDNHKVSWLLGIQVAAYTSWIVGTILGVVFGKELFNKSGLVSEALNFVLPALFFSIFLDQIKVIRLVPIIGCIVVTIISLIFIPAHISMLIGLLSGGIFGAISENKQ